MRSNKEILRLLKEKREYHRAQELEAWKDDDEDCCAGCRDGERVDAYDELIEFVIDLSDTQKAVRDIQEKAELKNREWAQALNAYYCYSLPPVKEMNMSIIELEAKGLPDPFRNKVFYVMRWLNTGD